MRSGLKFRGKVASADQSDGKPISGTHVGLKIEYFRRRIY